MKNLLLILLLFYTGKACGQNDSIFFVFDTLDYTVADSVWTPSNYLIPIEDEYGIESYIVVGDTMRAIEYTVSDLRRQNERLQYMLDGCWSDRREIQQRHSDFLDKLIIITGQ